MCVCVCKVNLKTLDVQALEVIAIANEAGATVFDVKILTLESICVSRL